MQSGDRLVPPVRAVPFARAAAIASLSALLMPGCAGQNSPGPAAVPARDDSDRPGRSADAKELGRSKVARAEELLIGRFPGVRVLRLPTGELAVRIRGQSTFLGNSEPLFVVDGLPLTPGTGALMGLNPDDIQRIEVLKDIGSTALYGMRGANGVVLITTKRQ